MARHFLSLDVPDTTNESVFRVKDTSVYTSSLPVSCISLQITPPGFQTATVIQPNFQGFDLVLNACALGIVPSTGCSDICPNLSDGVYSLYYSVAPNDQVYVSYFYLRIVSALNRLNTFLCDLALPSCLPDREMGYELKNIDIIRNYLRSAQTNVNNNINIEDGVNQYRYAIDLMGKMSVRKPKCRV